MNSTTETKFDGFDLYNLMMNTPVENAKAPAHVERVIYSDLEIACFLAHKDGLMGPASTFITNNHPLMVEAGITHNFADMHGKKINM